jgi:hypothetical protein
MADYKPGALAEESKKKAYKPGALAAESKARKEIPPPDPGLSPWEQFTTGLSDLAGSALHEASRFGSGINAAVNSLTRPDNDRQGILSELERASQKSGEAFYSPEQTPLLGLRQNLSKDAPLPLKIGAFVGDFLGGVALDPMNGPLDRFGKALGVSARGGAEALAATEAGQKAVQAGQRIVDPLNNSRLGSEANRWLHWMGTGPHQKMFKEVLGNYQNEVGYETQRVANVVDDIARETRRAQGTSRGMRDLIENTAATTGNHPIIDLVRKAVLDRTAGRTPLSELNPKQMQSILDRYANPFGVDPRFIVGKADEILQHIDDTEKLLYKSGVRPTINKGGAHDPLIKPEDWLDQMFGARKEAPTTIFQALTGKGEGGKAAVAQIYETGVRNLINDLPQHTKWVQPITEGLRPGWVAVPEGGILGSKLHGFQMPEQLYNALEVELARAAKVSANQIRPEYIKAFDAVQWYQKAIVGTAKKSLIGNLGTQIGNLTGNEYMLGKIFADAGQAVPDVERLRNVKMGFKTALGLEKGVRTSLTDRMSRWSPSLLTSQIESSIGAPAGNLGQLDKVRFIPGTNKSFTVPKPSGLTQRVFGEGRAGETAATVGKTLDTLNPATHLVNFQSRAEKAYKIAAFKSLTDRGIPDKQAVAIIERRLFDYTDRGVIPEMLDRFGGWIFNAFGTKQAGLFLDDLMENPLLLAKYARYQKQATAGADMSGIKQMPERYQNPFMVPIDNQGTALDLQRFHPMGASLEAASDVLTGKQSLLGAVPQMVGLGRAGETPTEAILNAGIFGEARDIAKGISPFSESNQVKPLLAEGQPENELGGIQNKLYTRTYAPGLLGIPGTDLGGRAYQDIRNAVRGVTRNDYPNQAAQDVMTVLLQHGLGLRTFQAQTEAQKEGKFDAAREKRAAVAEPVWDKLYSRAEKAIKNPHMEAAQKLTPKQAAAKAGKLQQYAFNLTQSPAVVDKNFKLTPEGEQRLRNAALQLVALVKRAEQEDLSQDDIYDPKTGKLLFRRIK